MFMPEEHKNRKTVDTHSRFTHFANGSSFAVLVYVITSLIVREYRANVFVTTAALHHCSLFIHFYLPSFLTLFALLSHCSATCGRYTRLCLCLCARSSVVWRRIVMVCIVCWCWLDNDEDGCHSVPSNVRRMSTVVSCASRKEHEHFMNRYV